MELLLFRIQGGRSLFIRRVYQSYVPYSLRQEHDCLSAWGNSYWCTIYLVQYTFYMACKQTGWQIRRSERDNERLHKKIECSSRFVQDTPGQARWFLPAYLSRHPALSIFMARTNLYIVRAHLEEGKVIALPTRFILACMSFPHTSASFWCFLLSCWMSVVERCALPVVGELDMFT